ncbi:hypothetical protein AYO20_09770 [Fonsecaea nubica]|uniref:Xylanolytic transcriptional activator regulatory domain-containing protein n=1 Tax=Fonsecaea nubica TaxID=856822 RepID=A0A178CD77_9EURO|nr:hypothetical protein AYO20_09770 [Fonsecaea nubica]OAL27487.1 hypothetical protein AYO20_09770 [Fonsecaea nubica]
MQSLLMRNTTCNAYTVGKAEKRQSTYCLSSLQAPESEMLWWPSMQTLCKVVSRMCLSTQAASNKDKDDARQPQSYGLREGVATTTTPTIPATSNSISPSRAPRAQDSECSLGPAQLHLSAGSPSLEKTATASHAGVDISDSSNTLVGSVTEVEDARVWLSTCSNAGVAWVCETTASLAFADIAERFGRSLQPWTPTSPWPSLGAARAEPSEETAWEYVNAFFENCWEARLGLIHRPDFEAQLQAHFLDDSSSRNDYAEIALRNVVFAAGYRSILLKTAKIPFHAVRKEAWEGYFVNALSVLTGLLLSPSRLMVVQALALMACYVEGLGSPDIQRVLCHNAVHAALTQGLHLDQESDHRTSSSSDDRLKKTWVWWAVYALEKHFCLVSGRPSMIDDDMIRASIPSHVPSNSTIYLEANTLAARHAKICSRILRETMSTKAYRLSPHALLRVVNDIDRQLKSLLDDFPNDLQVGALAKLSEETHPMAHRIHTLYLYFAIHGSLLALHSHFFYPWLSARLCDRGSDAGLEAQLHSSSKTVTEAARKMLLAVRTVTTNAATPTWLAVTYPIYAHLSLFVHVLKYPTFPTASADLGLLDICAGHFGYIDFMTSSEISISLARESVGLAAKFVKAANKRHDKDQTSRFSHGCGNQSTNSQSKRSDNESPQNAHPRSVSAALGQGDFTTVDGDWNMLPFLDPLGTHDNTWESLLLQHP